MDREHGRKFCSRGIHRGETENATQRKRGKRGMTRADTSGKIRRENKRHATLLVRTHHNSKRRLSQPTQVCCPILKAHHTHDTPTHLHLHSHRRPTRHTTTTTTTTEPAWPRRFEKNCVFKTKQKTTSSLKLLCFCVYTIHHDRSCSEVPSHVAAHACQRIHLSCPCD